VRAAAPLAALALVASVVAAPPAFAAAGDPDATFGGDGTVLTDFAAGFDAALAVTVQGDGKIVAAGYADGATVDFGVARYLRGGALDGSFSGDGIQTADFGESDQANVVAVQDDGKIVAAGYASTGPDRDLAIARFRAGGMLDPTFSGDGMKTIDFGSEFEEVYGVAVRPDGKIVVAGYTFDSVALAADFALARLKPGGAMDPSFSGDGKRTVDFGYDESIFAMELLSDGKFLVAGTSNDGVSARFALARLRPGGAPDATFSGDGITYTAFGSSATALAIDIRSDGKIALAGESDGGFALARYRPGGGLDHAFSGDGKVMVDLGIGGDAAHGVAFQDDGKIVVAGYASNGVDYDFVALRYRVGGSPDPTFSGDGLQLVDFGSGDDNAFAMVLQANGRIVVAGYADNGPDEDFALTRLLAA
jgi:uncharacterized delta-60 repeat protein